MRLSFRAEIRPTPRQRQALLQHAGNARWAYNWGLNRVGLDGNGGRMTTSYHSE